MRIAVVCETSSADKNADILAALDGRGHQVINAGMKKSGEEPQLLYTHTGLITAILLNLGRVDFVVGGCGTGQGYLNSVMQYPGVFCGHVLTPVDAWLFTLINGGNCISLALNQGYGWAGDVNLRFIFDRVFSVERGAGYPPTRREPQARARAALEQISATTHRTFADIIANMPEEIIGPALAYPGIWGLIDPERVEDARLKEAFHSRMPPRPRP
jgi:ribose 5-phosphate isomerase RpiB